MTITSFTLAGALGMDVVAVSIKCTIDANKPGAFQINGVSPTQAKEIAVRVRSAIYATGLCTWPEGQITIDIEAPGLQRVAPRAKLYSTVLDLPIACAIAGVNVEGLLVAGELGLDGGTRPVRGIVQATLAAKSLGLRGVLVPRANERDAKEVADASSVYALGHLVDLNGDLEVLRVERTVTVERSEATVDFAEIRGQAAVIATIEAAVRARKNTLLTGAPGTGKTMIARRIPTVLLQMSKDEQIEVTQVYSAIGMSDGLVVQRPFRAPHHTISTTALTGGGVSPRPGEAQLASCGVLFLDEVQEFSRAAIETLAFTIRMTPKTVRPLVVASATPCPCGWYGSSVRDCRCRPEAIARHAARLQEVSVQLELTTIEIEHVSLADLRDAPQGESSENIAARIAATC